jgi:hypothetical protein
MRVTKVFGAPAVKDETGTGPVTQAVGPAFLNVLVNEALIRGQVRSLYWTPIPLHRTDGLVSHSVGVPPSPTPYADR